MLAEDVGMRDECIARCESEGNCMGRRVREGGLKDGRKLLPDINRGGRGLRRSFRRGHAP